MSAPLFRHRNVLAFILLTALGSAATVAVGASEPCPIGPIDPATLPLVCAPVPGAPADAAGTGAVAIRSIDRDYLGALALRPAADPAGPLVLAGELPDLSGHAALTPADAESLWPCPVEIDDREARFAPVSFVIADADIELTLASGPLHGAPEPGQISILFLYADRAVRIDGTCTEGASTLHVGFSLRSGWNVIVSEVQSVDGERVTIALRDAISEDLAAAQWYWPAIPAGLREGPPPNVRPVEPPAER